MKEEEILESFFEGLRNAAPHETWYEKELLEALEIIPGNIVLAEETVFPKVATEVVAVVTGNIPVRIQDSIPEYVIEQMVTNCGIAQEIGGHVLPSYTSLVQAAKAMGDTEPTPTLEECRKTHLKELDLTPLVSINREFFTVTPEEIKKNSLTEREVIVANKVANMSLLFTIAHEAQHVWQFEGRGIKKGELVVGGPTNLQEYSAQWIERDANRAGKEFITNSSLIKNILERIVG